MCICEPFAVGAGDVSYNDDDDIPALAAESDPSDCEGGGSTEEHLTYWPIRYVESGGVFVSDCHKSYRSVDDPH